MAKEKEVKNKEEKTKKNVNEVVIKIDGEVWKNAMDKVFAKKQKDL